LRVTHHTDGAKERGHQLTGLALDVIESPHLSQRRLALGNELFARGFHHSALDLFLGLDRAESSAPIRSSALAMASSCIAALKGVSDDEVTDLLFRSARRDPGHRHPLIQLARVFVEAGNFQAAASFATAALSIPARVSYTELEENLREGPHAILYWALFWLGRRTEAQEHFRACMEMDPQNPIYLDHARLFSR
jgi:tetratricopeptide (TPR) repeat protein